MCKITKDLELIAEQLIKKEHKAIVMTKEEKQLFVNSVATIQEHSNFIQRTLSP